MSDEQLQKIDELTEEIKSLKSLYESEIKREAIERDSQNIRNTEQAEILAKEKQEIAKQVTLATEKQAKSDTEFQQFRNNLLSSVKSIEATSYNNEFSQLNGRLIAIEKNTGITESAKSSSFYADISIMFFLWFIFPAIFMYKSLDWFFSWM